MGMEDMDYYEYEESRKRFSLKKIIGFFFKLIVGVIVIGTFALIFLRSCFMNIPKDFEDYTFSEAAANAFMSGELDILLQAPVDDFDEEGYYHASYTALCKKTGELQVTLRYNSRSTINSLMEEYSLSEKPSGEVFVYMLSDNNGNVYTDYTFAERSRPMNEFRRLIFTGIDFTEVTELNLEVYYIGDVSNSSKMHATMNIYKSDVTSDTLKKATVKPTKLIFSEAPHYIDKTKE